MRSLMALAAVACAVCAYGCMGAYELQTPVDIGQQVTMLRSEAVGLRKDARDYELLVQKSKDAQHGHQIRLDAQNAKKIELDKRLQALQVEKIGAKPEQAEKTDRLIARYQGQMDTVLAQADGEKICMRCLEEQIKAQQNYRQALLTTADDREQAALRLEAYAKEISQRSSAR